VAGGREWIEASVENLEGGTGYVLGPSARAHTTFKSRVPYGEQTAGIESGGEPQQEVHSVPEPSENPQTPQSVPRRNGRRLLAVGALLAACIAVAAVMWLREDPYFFMVNALHAGMSPKDVVDALGEPCGNLFLYHKSGAPTMLLVLFDVRPPFAEPIREQPNWFIIDGPVVFGYTEYKVRKYHFFNPPSFGGERGVLEFHWSLRAGGEAKLVGLSTNVFKVDINGDPYPCFSRGTW
jgi:hypothetical protein